MEQYDLVFQQQYIYFQRWHLVYDRMSSMNPPVERLRIKLDVDWLLAHDLVPELLKT